MSAGTATAGRGPRRLELRLTPSGIVLAALLAAGVLVGPEVSDPGLAGLVWAALAACLVVGVLWPVVVVLSARPRVASVPVGAEVGRPLTLTVELASRWSEVSISCDEGGSAVGVPPGGTAHLEAPLTPLRRGTFERLPVELSTDGPFGLLRATRTVVAVTPRPLVVTPRAALRDDLDAPRSSPLSGPETSGRAAAAGEAVRSVRPYVVGDPAHLVHWPTTARTGALAVRELEPPTSHGLAVVVDLGTPAADGTLPARSPGTPLSPEEVPAELAVAHAAAVVERVLADGGHAVLCTAEPGPVAGRVGDARAAAERLARATRGRPGVPPPGWTVLRVEPVGGAHG